MKLVQLHKSGFAIYEITDHSLVISSLMVADWQKHEVLFGDIQVEDLYRMKENNKASLTWIVIYAAFGWKMLEESFLIRETHWLIMSILGFLMLFALVVFFFPKTRIHIPTKAQGMIRMYAAKPSEKKVADFIYNLEGKVKLSKRKPKNSLDDFKDALS